MEKYPYKSQVCDASVCVAVASNQVLVLPFDGGFPLG